MTRYFDMDGIEIQEHDVLEFTLTGYESIVYRDENDLYMMNGNPMLRDKRYLGSWEYLRKYYRVVRHLDW